jgi:hypothetical protein
MVDYKKSRISVESVAHLRQLVSLDRRVLEAFTKVANMILCGVETSKDPRLQFLTEARGIGLVKDLLSGKLRPVGINETFLNLIARIALRKLGGAIHNGLHKHDFGFNRTGSSGRAENLLQIVRALVQQSFRTGRPFAILQLDFENAFNSAFRKAIFDCIRRKHPELIPFARFRYHGLLVHFKDNNYYFVIHSKAGVSQGCLCSPAFFQMLMTEVLQEVRSDMETIALSYLNDVTIAKDSVRGL